MSADANNYDEGNQKTSAHGDRNSQRGRGNNMHMLPPSTAGGIMEAKMGGGRFRSIQAPGSSHMKQ